MAWVLALLLLILSIGILRLCGVRGPLLQICAAALLFGAAGYAVQGRPDLEGAPRSETDKRPAIPLTTLRHAFFGQFTGAESWLLISEGYASRGQTADAAGVLRSAVRERPGNVALWIGLGNALVDHAQAITPAAELAYRRAAELAPGHPAPRFFYGLALARSGDRAGALMLWNSALAEAPADAGWRPYVEDAIAALGGNRGVSRPGRSAPEVDRSASTPEPSTGSDRTPRRPPR
jgi:cytochrome c-type biogenesis protein CcmH/NrfG